MTKTKTCLLFAGARVLARTFAHEVSHDDAERTARQHGEVSRLGRRLQCYL